MVTVVPVMHPNRNTKVSRITGFWRCEFHVVRVSLVSDARPGARYDVDVVASTVTIGIVQFTGNELAQDNVDRLCPRFLTSAIIGRQSLIDTNRQPGSSLQLRDLTRVSFVLVSQHDAKYRSFARKLPPYSPSR